MTREIALIILNRGLRSFIFGILFAVLAIYLSKVGMTSIQIGIVIALSGGTAAVWTLGGGLLADRYGRKKMLLAYGVAITASSACLLLTRDHVLLTTILSASALASFAPGGGPVVAAEQALLSDKVSSVRRTTVFAAISLVGSFATAIGAYSGAITTFLQGFGWNEIDSYEPLFVAMVVSALLSVAVALVIKEPPRNRQNRPIVVLSPRSKWVASRLFFTGVIDYAGTSLSGPFFAYWFYLRFDADPAFIGIIMGTNFLLATISYPIGVKLAQRFGVVRAIVGSRIPYVVLVMSLPFSPTLGIAAATYLLRGFVGIMDVPLRLSYTMGIIPSDERASVAAIGQFGRRAPTILSPIISGALLQIGLLFLPFASAGLLQLSEAGLFYKFFRKIKPPEEISST